MFKSRGVYDISGILYSKYTDYDIFKFYIPNFEIGTLIKSPLRKDRTPSFSFYVNNNGNINYKDFGTGERGNVFQFIKRKYGISYIDAVKKAYYDLNNFKTAPDFQRKFEKRKSKQFFYYKYTKIRQKHINFWNQYINNLELLNHLKIYPISKIYSKNSNYIVKHGYVYIIGNRVKFHLPENNLKYFGNSNKNSIMGFNQINFKDRVLFLVSSMKELLVMKELGYNAIAPNSESSIIDFHIISFLKFYFNIVILYDWDQAGRLNAIKHSKIYNVKISKYQFSEIKPKDISDFSKNYGLNQLNQYLNEIRCLRNIETW